MIIHIFIEVVLIKKIDIYIEGYNVFNLLWEFTPLVMMFWLFELVFILIQNK